MTGAGIHSGDLLIVDRALTPENNRIVIAVLDGEMTVKRFRREGGRVFLLPENGDFTPIEVTPEMRFEVWGVVAHVIHPL
jgi:DNA polymerase V